MSGKKREHSHSELKCVVGQFRAILGRGAEDADESPLPSVPFAMPQEPVRVMSHDSPPPTSARLVAARRRLDAGRAGDAAAANGEDAQFEAPLVLICARCFSSSVPVEPLQDPPRPIFRASRMTPANCCATLR